MRAWFKAAGLRALKTAIQTFVASIATTTMITDINWPVVLSTTAIATLCSFLTSIATHLPELDTGLDTVKESEEETNDV